MSFFAIQNENLLSVELQNEVVLSRSGAMVAYEGEMTFSKAILGGEGIFRALKRKIAKEREQLMTVEGSGTVYFAHEAKEVSLIQLDDDKVFIESSCLLAYDTSLHTNVAFSGLHGMASDQGLFTTSVKGSGAVAVISDGNLLQLEVSAESPLFIDPDAFIAYTGELRREFILDINWKTAIGEASGESYQIKFTGQGMVYIQPSEQRPQ
jgi:uncharacterized protein (AIM24 family)